MSALWCEHGHAPAGFCAACALERDQDAGEIEAARLRRVAAVAEVAEEDAGGVSNVDDDGALLPDAVVTLGVPQAYGGVRRGGVWREYAVRL